MGGDGVSDISAGADEGVGRMVNGADLTSGSIPRLGVAVLWGVETRVDNELAKVRGFLEGILLLRKATMIWPKYSF